MSERASEVGETLAHMLPDGFVLLYPEGAGIRMLSTIWSKDAIIELLEGHAESLRDGDHEPILHFPSRPS